MFLRLKSCAVFFSSVPDTDHRMYKGLQPEIQHKTRLSMKKVCANIRVNGKLPLLSTFP